MTEVEIELLSSLRLLAGYVLAWDVFAADAGWTNAPGSLRAEAAERYARYQRAADAYDRERERVRLYKQEDQVPK